jgi:hypothetical protein
MNIKRRGAEAQRGKAIASRKDAKAQRDAKIFLFEFKAFLFVLAHSFNFAL